MDNGDIIFRSEEGGSYYVLRMNGDGSGRDKLLPFPVIRLSNVSPDGQWIIVWMPVEDENTSSAVQAYRLTDKKLVRFCDLCSVAWSLDRKYLYFFSPGVGANRVKRHEGIYALPLRSDQMLPVLPPGGLTSTTDYGKLSAIQLPESETDGITPGPDQRVYAFSRRTIQRNLFRVPLP